MFSMLEVRLRFATYIRMAIKAMMAREARRRIVFSVMRLAPKKGAR
jgi:hypothetical protein